MIPPVEAPIQSTPPISAEDEVDWENIVTEDDEPVDNILSSHHMRCWHEPLRDSWKPGRKFICNANVGVFPHPMGQPLVPDFFLSMDVETPADLELKANDKRNRSYFISEYGKPPDLTIELVSNKKGGELSQKIIDYAAMGVRYYVVYDPGQFIQKQIVASYELVGGIYQLMPGPDFPALGLRLVEWEGEFENCWRKWLRWADMGGNFIPFSKESVSVEKQRAEEEKQRAEEEKQRAEEEKQRAEEEKQRAEAEKQRAEEQQQHAEEEKRRAKEQQQRAEEEKRRAEEEKQRAEEEKQRAEEERRRAEEEKQRAESAEQQLEKLAAKLKAKGIDPDQL